MKKKQRLFSGLGGIISVMTVLLLCHAAPAAAAESPQAMFYRGNEYMQAGDFEQAAQAYEAVLQQGEESGALYYNLGNAYVKQGKLGKALVNYERARRLIPADSDLNANREFVKNQLASRIPETKQLAPAALIRRISFSWTLDGLIVACLCLYWVLCAVLLLRILARWRGGMAKALFISLLGGLLLLGVAAGVKYHDERIVQTAVITVAQTDGRFGPSDDATVYFRLYEGTPVQIIQSNGDWARVKTPDGRFGWIPADGMERVALSAA